MQGAWVWTLVRELRSHLLSGMAKKKTKQTPLKTRTTTLFKLSVHAVWGGCPTQPRDGDTQICRSGVTGRPVGCRLLCSPKEGDVFHLGCEVARLWILCCKATACLMIASTYQQQLYDNAVSSGKQGWDHILMTSSDQPSLRLFLASLITWTNHESLPCPPPFFLKQGWIEFFKLVAKRVKMYKLNWTNSWTSPSSPVVKMPHFHCKGLSFHPSKDPAFCEVQPPPTKGLIP